MEKNKKLSLQSLLYNKKFLVCFSAAMALIIWVAVTLNESPEVERTIKNVKVNIDTSVPEQLGYKLFGEKDYYVDVTVKGKRYLVGDNVLSAEDINVTAITSYVDAVGKYSLLLKATAKDPNAGFKITTKSLDYIDVYFDVPKEVEMTLTPDIVISDKLLVSDEYMADTEVLSTNKIKISGPATEINKINNVVARINVPEPLKASQSFPAEILITDAYGDSLKYLKVDTGESDVSITIPVYKIAELPVNVEFKNSPTDYINNTLGVSTSVRTIKIAAAEDVIANMTSAIVGTIDFNSINQGKNTFVFNTADMQNFKVLSDIKDVTVNVDASEMKKTSNISITNIADGYTATVAQSTIDNVVIIGPKSEISNLSQDDITAVVDLTDKKLSDGKQTVTAQVSVKNGKCWAYGSYKVQINVAKK